MKPGEMIAVLEAFAAGKKIEFQLIKGGAWLPCPEPSWNFAKSDYRVAEAPMIPHYPALCCDEGHYYITDSIFSSLDEAMEEDFINVVRLATEFPPIMLPRMES